MDERLNHETGWLELAKDVLTWAASVGLAVLIWGALRTLPPFLDAPWYLDLTSLLLLAFLLLELLASCPLLDA